MVPLCMVHVGNQSGEMQLMDGDIQRLRRLLPNVSSTSKFEIGTEVRLAPGEALELLSHLQALDLAQAGDEQYWRSAIHQQRGSVRNLVEPFIEFLEAELEIAA